MKHASLKILSEFHESTPYDDTDSSHDNVFMTPAWMKGYTESEVSQWGHDPSTEPTEWAESELKSRISPDLSLEFLGQLNLPDDADILEILKLHYPEDHPPFTNEEVKHITEVLDDVLAGDENCFGIHWDRSTDIITVYASY